MNAFINHLSFDFRTGIRNKTLLLMNYLFPLGFYILMGVLMIRINPMFQETMIPAMVVFTLLVSMLLGLPDPLVCSRDNGILRNYKINGIPASSILVIPAINTILHTIIITIIIIITAPLFFIAPLPINWINFIVIFFLMAFACSGLGILIGVISSSSRISVLWSQLIFLPSMLLGGMMVPYDMLPGKMAKIAQLLPATHAMNAFRSLAYGQIADFNPTGSLVILLTSGLLAFGLAIYLFNWDKFHLTQHHGHQIMAFLVLLPYIIGIFLLS